MAALVRLNVGSLMGLTVAVLPGMIARGDGVVVNVASTGAFQPVPYMAVYAATKAFVLSFTEALWGECRGTGVRVLALCPGPTATGMTGDGASFGRLRTPEQVVATALAGLARGKASVVDGRVNAALARIGVRLLPERLMVRIAGSAMQFRAVAARQGGPGAGQALI